MSSRAMIAAAKTVLHENGYSKTQLKDIQKAANLSDAEINCDFKSLDECCLKVLESYSGELKEKFSKIEENTNARQRLSLYLDDFYDNAGMIAKNGQPLFNLYNDFLGKNNALSVAVEGLMKMQHDWVDEQFTIMLKAEGSIGQGDRLMAAIYGLFFLAHLRNDPAMLKNQIIQLRSWIRSM